MPTKVDSPLENPNQGERLNLPPRLLVPPTGSSTAESLSNQTSPLPSPTGPRPVRRKLVVVGDGACGKTSLLVAYCDDKFSFDYVPTVFATTVTCVPVEEKIIELSLWDTAGQEDYDRLRPLSYGDTHVVLVCFALDRPESLQSVVRKWVPDLDLYCPGVPRILVGCKSDLRPGGAEGGGAAAATALNLVGRDQGLAMAEHVEAVSYIECSAKTRDNVKAVFAQAARVSLTYQKRKKRTASDNNVIVQKIKRGRKKCGII